MPGLRFNKYGNVIHIDGFTESDSGAVHSVGDFERTFSYFAFPVRLKLSLPIKPKLYIFGGIEYGFLISARGKTDVVNTINSEEEMIQDEGDIDKFYKNSNITISGGAGIELTINKYSFYVQAHYSQGLTNIFDSTSSNNEIKTKEMALSLGYAF